MAPYHDGAHQDEHIMIERPPRSMPQPPVNFGTVTHSVYRSAYPAAADYSFIASLKLRSIVTLVSKDLPEGFGKFMEQNHIAHHVFDMAGTKKVDIPIVLMREIQAFIADAANLPLLIHCNHGKHRTGCVVGVLRLASGWDAREAVREYASFAAPKVRDADVTYLTNFQLASLRPETAAAFVSRGMRMPVVAITRFPRLVIAAAVALCLWVLALGRLAVPSKPISPKQDSSL
ncbi:tyrosine phosphatase family-domain-containing protein [Xylariaceae sp. FL0804]|nr:tyrosine phosphatase family-domain-containing protein [Xylariaceae sp. FL0804]